MESRRLFASILSGGILSIPGTGAADVITVTHDGPNLNVITNGVLQAFPAGNVKSISAALGAGDDSIAIDDTVTTNATLLGEAGDDTLCGGLGSDSIDGGDGTDTVTYAGRTGSVSGGLTVIRSSTFDVETGVETSHTATRGDAGSGDESDALAAVETLAGGDGDDDLSLYDSTDDTVRGNSFLEPVDRLISGGAGNDRLTVGGAYGYESIYAGFVADGDAGDDMLVYADIDGSMLRGGAGDDTFIKETDDFFSTVIGGDGFDTYECSDGSGVIYSLPADLEAFSSDRATVFGNDADNVISIVSGSVDGAGGNDTITVRSGVARGDAGNDRLIVEPGGAGGDLYGGAGDDTLYGSDQSDALFGESGRDKLWGRGGDDTLEGGSGNDILRGEAGNDRLLGGNGNDRLDGGDGRDRLLGEVGDDFLVGGIDRDTLYGGEGADAGDKDPDDRVVHDIELLA